MRSFGATSRTAGSANQLYPETLTSLGAATPTHCKRHTLEAAIGLSSSVRREWRLKPGARVSQKRRAQIEQAAPALLGLLTVPYTETTESATNRTVTRTVIKISEAPTVRFQASVAEGNGISTTRENVRSIDVPVANTKKFENSLGSGRTHNLCREIGNWRSYVVKA
ncbi:hypothetical protein B0H17DRAFT_1134161 [Mycena rosella]|uniref:Uncharacterized protein n=1 Tax=Mycena rosella TaxID=1033263 RepID=A0AAD7DG55_MYCRO|nr:hypothetical protein B0H17DRAFT_1134161 [Mycena rosella]